MLLPFPEGGPVKRVVVVDDDRGDLGPPSASCSRPRDSPSTSPETRSAALAGTILRGAPTSSSSTSTCRA